MGIKCFKCNEYFVAGVNNVKIIGPDVEASCPFCYDVYTGKLNKFSCAQAGTFMPSSPNYAAAAQRMAQYIELNSSDYYKERGLRHGGKKKVRDLRARESAAREESH